jgi:hypothetical protein
MKRFSFHPSHPAAGRCPRCQSKLPRPVSVVAEAAAVAPFAIGTHLAAPAKVWPIAPLPPAFDYFAFFPYGYLY